MGVEETISWMDSNSSKNKEMTKIERKTSFGGKRTRFDREPIAIDKSQGGGSLCRLSVGYGDELGDILGCLDEMFSRL